MGKQFAKIFQYGGYAGCVLLRLMLQGRKRQKPKTNAPERDKLTAYWWIIITGQMKLR